MALPLVLMLMTLILVLGMGFLTRKAAQLRASKELLDSFAANSLAWAGMEDVRLKLNLDPSFPPGLGQEQQFFGYTERLRDENNDVVGSYTVTIDMRYDQAPYRILLIEVVGRSGDDSVFARRTLRAEFDIAPDLISGVRGDDGDQTTYTNPQYWKFVRIQDEASL